VSPPPRFNDPLDTSDDDPSASTRLSSSGWPAGNLCPRPTRIVSSSTNTESSTGRYASRSSVKSAMSSLFPTRPDSFDCFDALPDGPDLSPCEVDALPDGPDPSSRTVVGGTGTAEALARGGRDGPASDGVRGTRDGPGGGTAQKSASSRVISSNTGEARSRDSSVGWFSRGKNGVVGGSRGMLSRCTAARRFTSRSLTSAWIASDERWLDP
jgi:hypothetical protein